MLSRARSPLPWLAALLVVYELAPIGAFAARLRGGVPAAPGVGAALATSLATATISAAVIALLGTPLAYLLARARGPAARVLGALVALPLALPPLMSGLLLLYVLGPYTLAGRLFDGKLTETRLAIVLAQTFVAAPFMVIAARAAFAAVDPALEDVAATLGHGRFARFARVAVPAAMPGIGAGVLLAWLRAFGEFGATVILAYHPYSLPVFTFVQFDAAGLGATDAPIALALGAALVVLLAIALPLPRRRRTSARTHELARETGGRRRRSRTWRARPAAARAAASRAPSGGAGDGATVDFAVARRLPGFSLEFSHRSHSPHLALLGASGAGKTLTLRLLAGLLASDGTAHLRIGGHTLHQLPTERRRVGYVPQQPALLPRRVVWRQVMFGARARPDAAAGWIERLGLAGLEGRYPDELSGGQQRRVALARALASEPQLLLLDEPFSGLDAPVRERLRRELRRLQRERALSTVLVTHDPEEAAMLAEEIIVLSEGRVLQAGTREAVFGAPRSPEVAALLGIANMHAGEIEAAGRIRSGGALIEAPTGRLPAGGKVAWCVRPEQVALDPRGPYACVVLDRADLGAVRELTVRVGESLELVVRTSAPLELRAGAEVRVRVAPEQISVWAL